jgi:heme A synthase
MFFFVVSFASLCTVVIPLGFFLIQVYTGSLVQAEEARRAYDAMTEKLLCHHIQNLGDKFQAVSAPLSSDLGTIHFLEY